MADCNCIEKLEEKLKKQSDEIENVSIANYELISGRGYDEFNVFIKGKKKPSITKVLHGWCPFCGKKYENYTHKTIGEPPNGFIKENKK